MNRLIVGAGLVPAHCVGVEGDMIRITRGNAWRDKLRAYKIYANDMYLGDISNNEVAEFSVAKGHYSICAKIDWCGSNTIDIVVDDELVELEVGSSVKKNSWWKELIPFYEIYQMTIKRNKYLWLREKV